MFPFPFKGALLAIGTVLLFIQPVKAEPPPVNVPTIVVRGFDSEGILSTGIYGLDETSDYITNMATVLGLPLSTDAPTAMDQVAYTNFYGTNPPAYYTTQDIDDITSVTTIHGGGVPRYAHIIGKFARHVMDRTGAEKVNILAVSFGGLVSRYMIEHDVEGLASSDSIARWVVIEGVVAGNYAAQYGGPLAQTFFSELYGVDPIDIEHMSYDWVAANIHHQRHTTVSPYYANFPTHFWQATDHDIEDDDWLTILSGKTNDGVVLAEDAILRHVPAQSRFLGLDPTISAISTNHNATKNYPGIRAGVAAQLFGNIRLHVTLEEIRIHRQFDSGRGPGEYSFGVRVYSPQADSIYGITDPIHELKPKDAAVPLITNIIQNTSVPVNIQWFDDMVLPFETELVIEPNVKEVDNNFIYQIAETFSEDSYDNLESHTVAVSTTTSGTYHIITNDWTGRLQVGISDHNYVEPGPPTAAANWFLYE